MSDSSSADGDDEVEIDLDADVDLDLEADRPAGDSPTTVLYVEDDAVNVLLVERILEMRPDLRLLVATDAERGIEMARQARPDLILLDMRLPDMRGDEVLGHLRADPRTSRTPVIVLTADDDPELVHRLLSMGASAFLPKPIDLARFLDVVDEHISQHRVGDSGDRPR